MEKTLGVIGKSLGVISLDVFRKSGFYISGMIALERDFILIAMILAAIVVYVIDKDFFKAACWAVVGSILSFVGIIHAYKLTGGGIVSVLGINTFPYFSIGYLVMGGAFFLTGLMTKNTEKAQ